MSAVMPPDEMRAEAEAFVRRCVVGIKCSEEEIQRAANSAFEAFTWRIDAIRRSGILGWPASGTEARQRPDPEEGLDPKGDGPTLEERDAQTVPSPSSRERK